MGYYCTVPQCTSLAGKTKNVKFHRFPRDVTMADKWNSLLKRGKPYTKYSKVCSLHFTQADYNVTTMGQWKTLSKDAVPSQNLPRLNPDGTVMVIRKSRTVKSVCKETTKKEYDVNIVENNSEWPLTSVPAPSCDNVPQENQGNVSYRFLTLNLMNNASTTEQRPKKQDAIMQTDPVLDDDGSECDLASVDELKTDSPSDDYVQTNEEYNKAAENYALERKSHGFDKNFKQVEQPYVKEVYFEGYTTYPNESRPVELIQERNEYFNESIKQEVVEEDGYMKEGFDRSKEAPFQERSKDPLSFEENDVIYDHRQRVEPIPEKAYYDAQVKSEPDMNLGCDTAAVNQETPFYQTNGHSDIVGYESYPAGFPRAGPAPGPELLIAKQNALAAHTQLWQNSLKRPFFYSENPHCNAAPLLHARYEDLTRILNQ